MQTLGCCSELRNLKLFRGVFADKMNYRSLIIPRSCIVKSSSSSLPLPQDGSCNGLQHYAALGRDVIGATSVNLVPCDVPQDVYSGVAQQVLLLFLSGRSVPEGRGRKMKVFVFTAKDHPLLWVQELRSSVRPAETHQSKLWSSDASGRGGPLTVTGEDLMKLPDCGYY